MKKILILLLVLLLMVGSMPAVLAASVCLSSQALTVVGAFPANTTISTTITISSCGISPFS